MCKIEKGESGLALVANRHAWIDALLAVLGSETERVDRRTWIGVLLGTVLLAWIEISESLEKRGVKMLE